MHQAAGFSPLVSGSPAKVVLSGTLASVVSVNEHCRGNLVPTFVLPPGLGFATAIPSPVATRKMSREDCSSEAETCSGSDRGAPSPLPSLGSESAGSGSEGAGQSLGLPKYGSPSVGSALHDDGDCRPCAWYWKPSGCENAASCPFCHMCPEGEVKNRKKSKLVAMRQARRSSQQEGGVDGDNGAQQHPVISL